MFFIVIVISFISCCFCFFLLIQRYQCLYDDILNTKILPLSSFKQRITFPSQRHFALNFLFIFCFFYICSMLTTSYYIAFLYSQMGEEVSVLIDASLDHDYKFQKELFEHVLSLSLLKN